MLEVLSPSTEAYDLGAKLHHYRRLPTLREHVVLAPDQRFASVSRRACDLWAFEDLGPQDVLHLPSIDVQLPLGALYRDALGDIAP